MGIKKWLKNAGGWVKDKFHKAKNIVQKYAKPVVQTVRNVMNGLNDSPFGGAINAATGGIFDNIRRFVNWIPVGSSVKNNVDKFANRLDNDKAKQFVGKDGIRKFNDVIDKGKEVIGAGKAVLGAGNSLFNKGKELINAGREAVKPM